MSKDNEIPASQMIEAAMERVAAEAALKKAQANPLSNGHHDRDQALEHRADQLRTAMEPDGQAMSVQQPQIQEPESAHPLPPNDPSHGNRYGPGFSLFLGAIFTTIGAGFVWMTVSGADHSRPPEPAAPAALTSAAPAATEVSVPAAAVTAPPIAPQIAVDDSEAQARDLIERWRQAWASRDIEAYLSAYSAEFVSAKGQKLQNWAKERRSKLSRQSDISVQVQDMTIERIGDDQMKVVFLQDYESGAYREKATPKTMLLTRTGNEWLIAGEWQGRYPLPQVAAK